MEIVVIWIALAIVIAIWANSRGHSAVVSLLGSLLLSPLLGFLIELANGKNVKATEAAAVASGEMRKCPACAELVKAEALKCRYCGEALTPTPAVPDEDRSWL